MKINQEKSAFIVAIGILLASIVAFIGTVTNTISTNIFVIAMIVSFGICFVGILAHTIIEFKRDFLSGD